MSFPPDIPLLPADNVRLLWAGDALPSTMRTIERAVQRLDVAMFIAGLGTSMICLGRIRELLDAVIAARHRGVDCRILLSPFQDEPPVNDVAAHYLLAGKVPTRRYSSDRHNSMHSKFLLVDDDVAIVGSGNWSAGGLTANLEAAVYVVSQPFTRSLRRRFDGDWSRALEHEPLL